MAVAAAEVRRAMIERINWKCVAICGVIVFALYSIMAQARWRPEYASASAEERAWYDRQQTTPETRKRISAPWYMVCCDDADTVQADFKKSDGHWHYRQKGETEWHSVPDDTVQADVQTPHGKPVLFVDVTYLRAGPVCFFPGAAGT